MERNGIIKTINIKQSLLFKSTFSHLVQNLLSLKIFPDDKNK